MWIKVGGRLVFDGFSIGVRLENANREERLPAELIQVPRIETHL